MPGPAAGDADSVAAPAPSRLRRWRSRRVVVQDESMRPTLEPGDRLLVDPRAYRRRPPRVGDVVVVVDPEVPSRWLVKRVADVDPGGRTIDVRGDAVATARDSRRFGRVEIRAVVGQVYRLYFPRERRRSL